MTFEEKEFIPLLLGGDINTYSVARAFYEQYGVQTHCCGKYMSGPSCNSKIVIYTANPKIDTEAMFVRKVSKFAFQHPDKKIVLIGCGDSYVALIARLKHKLPDNIIAPYIDFEMMNDLQQKERFYQLCDRHGLDHPETFVYRKETGMDFELPFEFPVILKPSNSVRYWECPFEGQSKIYYMADMTELKKTLGEIYGAGYDDAMIIQDTIPGKDEQMRVLTCYSDRNGKVKMMCLGHVLLEEHTPLGRGNHAVIITEPNQELMMKAKKLLEDIHYIGYSNFDIKYDTRDGKFKFFEINTRQGRSNYYVTGSGFNIAKYIVEEYVYGRELELEVATEEHLWTVLPKGVMEKYVHDPECKAKMEKLLNEGKWVNPIFMKGDNKLMRWLKMKKNHLRQYGNYKRYYSVDN